MDRRWLRCARTCESAFTSSENQLLFLPSRWTVWGAAGNWPIGLCLGYVPRKECFIDPNRKPDSQHREPKNPTGQESLKNDHGVAGLFVIRKDRSSSVRHFRRQLVVAGAVDGMVGLPPGLRGPGSSLLNIAV